MKEPQYTIVRRMDYRNAVAEDTKPGYFYLVKHGCKKVCEVWAVKGHLKKSYDKNGKLICQATPKMTLDVSSPRFTLAFMILRDAFDLKIALEWASLIRILLPDDPSPHVYGQSVVVYTKADLFSAILEARDPKLGTMAHVTL